MNHDKQHRREKAEHQVQHEEEAADRGEDKADTLLRIQRVETKLRILRTRLEREEKADGDG